MTHTEHTQLPTAGRTPLFPLSSISLAAPSATFLPSPVSAKAVSKTTSNMSKKPSFRVSTTSQQDSQLPPAQLPSAQLPSAQALSEQVSTNETAPDEMMFAAPKVTLPVTLGSLELTFAREEITASKPAANEPKPLPTEPCNHKDAAEAVGISQALLACYVSIYRSLGGRLEYSTDNLRSNKYALKPRYSPDLIAGFRNVRTQVRAGADIRSAMTIVMIQQTSGQDPIAAITATASTKAATKRKRNTAKLETLASVNDSLSKEVAALQAKLDVLEPS